MQENWILIYIVLWSLPCSCLSLLLSFILPPLACTYRAHCRKVFTYDMYIVFVRGGLAVQLFVYSHVDRHPVWNQFDNFLPGLVVLLTTLTFLRLVPAYASNWTEGWSDLKFTMMRSWHLHFWLSNHDVTICCFGPTFWDLCTILAEWNIDIASGSIKYIRDQSLCWTRCVTWIQKYVTKLYVGKCWITPAIAAGSTPALLCHLLSIYFKCGKYRLWAGFWPGSC